MTARAGNTSVLVAAVVEGRTLAETARLARMSISTLQRRLRDDDVVEAIREARTRQRIEILGQLAGLRTQALDVVTHLLAHESPTVALRAATLVLRTSTSFDELVDLDARVRALEAAPERLPAPSPLPALEETEGEVPDDPTA